LKIQKAKKYTNVLTPIYKTTKGNISEVDCVCVFTYRHRMNGEVTLTIGIRSERKLQKTLFLRLFKIHFHLEKFAVHCCEAHTGGEKNKSVNVVTIIFPKFWAHVR